MAFGFSLLVGLYLLPSIIAVARGALTGKFFFANLFLGWTGLLWLWLLYLATRDTDAIKRLFADT